MKDEGNQSFKSCGLWLPVGVTGSGFACGAAGAAVHVGSAGFSDWRAVRAVVFEAGAPCCCWRCSLCLCSSSNTALFWDVMSSSASHIQDPGTEGKTSSGFPCQMQLTNLLPTSQEYRRILYLSDAACF